MYKRDARLAILSTVCNHCISSTSSCSGSSVMQLACYSYGVANAAARSAAQREYWIDRSCIVLHTFVLSVPAGSEIAVLVYNRHVT
jgi:hypothetical protein